MSRQAQAAAQIRAELKKHGIPARVRSRSASMVTAVDVTLYDPLPATLQRVKEFASQYQYGHFDGMVDCYEYSNKRDDLPQVKYVSVDADYSPELRQAVWNWLRERFDNFHGAPEDHRQASSFRLPNGSGYADQALWRALHDSMPFDGFWASRKPRQRAA